MINMLDEAHDRIRELEAACEEYRSEFISAHEQKAKLERHVEQLVGEIGLLRGQLRQMDGGTAREPRRFGVWCVSTGLWYSTDEMSREDAEAAARHMNGVGKRVTSLDRRFGVEYEARPMAAKGGV